MLANTERGGYRRRPHTPTHGAGKQSARGPVGVRRGRDSDACVGVVRGGTPGLPQVPAESGASVAYPWCVIRSGSQTHASSQGPILVMEVSQPSRGCVCYYVVYDRNCCPVPTERLLQHSPQRGRGVSATPVPSCSTQRLCLYFPCKGGVAVPLVNKTS